MDKFLQFAFTAQSIFEDDPSAEELVAVAKERASNLNAIVSDFAEKASMISAEKEKCVDLASLELKDVNADLATVDSRLEATKLRCQEVTDGMERTKARIEQLKTDGKRIKSEVSDNNLAMDSTCASLNTRRQLLFRITRLTWDEKAMDKNIVKGFVVNPLKNTVSVFEADQSMSDTAAICDFLWDYVASGIHSQWETVN